MDGYYAWMLMSSSLVLMMTTPALLYMVSKEMTDPKEQYVLANVIVQTIPMVTLLVFTFLGDGLRDALDPYSK